MNKNNEEGIIIKPGVSGVGKVNDDSLEQEKPLTKRKYEKLLAECDEKAREVINRSLKSETDTLRTTNEVCELFKKEIDSLKKQNEIHEKALKNIYHISTFDHDERFQKATGYDECIRMAREALGIELTEYDGKGNVVSHIK